MADAVMDFGYSLCEGYPALIICSLLLLAYLMKELFPDIYAYHTGLKSEYEDGKMLKNLAAHSRDFSRELTASLNSLFQ